ncbi:MAG: hypothetical protein LBE17_11295 [Treponema sp.]|jgi:hypothetical protein|nr:hypothetical protein [Treponema sp.]
MMKKLYVCVVILLTGAASLWADLPPRVFEIGFNGGGGFANNYLGAADVFKKTVVIDLTAEPEPLYIDFSGDFDFFINLNIKDQMGFGVFSNVDVLGQFSLSKDIQDFLQGNELNKTYEGDIGIGAAAFVEAGAHGYFNIKKFRIAVRPAYFLPLAYMKPDAHYTIRTGSAGDVYVDFEYNMAVYTPFEMRDTGGGIADILDNTTISPTSLTGRGGFDLTAGVDYPLLPNLTVGATITHIPIFPALLTNKAVISGGKQLNSQDMLDDLINGGGLEDLLKDRTVESSHGDLQVFRPFKFGVNAVYTPFKHKLYALALIPRIGYAYNAIYLKPHSFEGSIAARLGLFNVSRSNAVLAFTVSSGYEDKVWKQGAGLTLNFRAVQIDIGVASQSEHIGKSFTGAGLEVALGMCFGW